MTNDRREIGQISIFFLQHMIISPERLTTRAPDIANLSFSLPKISFLFKGSRNTLFFLSNY